MLNAGGTWGLFGRRVGGKRVCLRVMGMGCRLVKKRYLCGYE